MQDDFLTDTTDPHLDMWFKIPVPMVKEMHAGGAFWISVMHMGLSVLYLWMPSKTGEEHLNVVDARPCTGITI